MDLMEAVKRAADQLGVPVIEGEPYRQIDEHGEIFADSNSVVKIPRRGSVTATRNLTIS